MQVEIREMERMEILTLQDNYFDALIGDSSEMVQRAIPVKDMEVKNTLLAEHGFSSLVTISRKNESQSLLFDFGFSSFGAAFNADALDLDLSIVDALVLSHGHLDHTGGLKALVSKTGKKDLPLILHPVAFREQRFIKMSQPLKFKFPSFTLEKAAEANVSLVETCDPYPLLDNTALFLGTIPRQTDFEKGAPNFFFIEDGEEKPDMIEDDTALVVNIRDRGLIILSGCAHSGIINTINHAKKVTGQEKVLAVIGGFHLTGPAMAQVIDPTIEALRQIDPEYIVPTHCTGRQAALKIEQAFPDKFLLNMTGTKLVFAS